MDSPALNNVRTLLDVRAFCMAMYMQATALDCPCEVPCRREATVIENFRRPSRGEGVYNIILYVRIGFLIGTCSQFPTTKVL